MGEALLAGLNDAQVEAVTTDGAPVVVLAGAGSGKTRVLTRRIAWRIATDQTDPSRVLALTFTRKAAGELSQRVRALGLRDQVMAGTFHATALVQLRQRWAERGVTPPTILDQRARLVSRLLPRGGSRRGHEQGRSQGRIRAGDVLAEIDWARARVVPPEDYPAAATEAGRTPPLPADAISELMVRYQQEKRRRRLVDFDDLLVLALRDLRSDQAYAEAVRWRHRHLYVDEFQDVNPLQYELLSEWRGGRPDLFVVGDPRQAIYGWNGADPNLLTRFVRREPEATVVELTTNYRSTPQVLTLAASLTSLGPRSGPLEASRPDGPTPTITPYPDDEAEADGIAQRARAARAVAGSWSDQAVLVRTNAQLLVIEQALRQAGVPTRLRGAAGPLATPEVRAELQRLEGLEVNLAAAVGELADRLAGDAEPAAGTTDAGTTDAGTTPPPLPVAEIERRANLGAFVRVANEYLTTDPSPSGPGLAAWITTLQEGDVDTGADAVDLTTFHGAKGLEWPVVHVAGLEEGFVPIAYASTGAQLAEEQRLLYVALTRAEDELHLSWAAERTFANRAVKRQASPHLGALAAAVARLGVGPAQRVDWRAQLALSRQELDRVPAPAVNPKGRGRSRRPAGAGAGATAGVGQDDPGAVYQALLSWRQRKARAADVAPHALFTDHTLRAIATARPGTRAALASVPGMRPAKLARYGDDLLEVLSGHPQPH